MSAWKVIVATLVIFAAGLVAGGFIATRLIPAQAGETKRPRPFLPRPLRTEYLNSMSRKLELTEKQTIAVSNIVHDSQERVRILYDLISPDLAEEMRLTREEIKAVLTPEQREKFESMAGKRPRRPGEGRGQPSHRNPRRPGSGTSPDGSQEGGANPRKKAVPVGDQ